MIYEFFIFGKNLHFFGGSLQIDKSLFQVFLFIVLTLAGTLLLINFKSYDDNESTYKNIPIFISIIIGAILGFISGVVGWVGGGGAGGNDCQAAVAGTTNRGGGGGGGKSAPGSPAAAANNRSY